MHRCIFFLLLIPVLLQTGCASLSRQGRPTAVLPESAVSAEDLPCDTAQAPGYFSKNRGKLIPHSSTGPYRTPAGYPVWELQNGNRFPVGFSTFIEKEVCTDSVCKRVKAWLFWDRVGNYLGLSTPCSQPLTKSDHTTFDQEDYEQLDLILKDTSSVLRRLEYRDLTSIDPGSEYPGNLPASGIDAISGATSPALQDVVVKDAVYTCYTLWHTVHGYYYPQIQAILDIRTNRLFLKQLFRSGVPSHQAWALRYVSEKNMNRKTIRLLISAMKDTGTNTQSEILEKLAGAETLETRAVTTLLKMYETGAIDVTLLHSVYTLVRPPHLRDDRVLFILNRLMLSENNYIKNMTRQLLLPDN